MDSGTHGIGLEERGFFVGVKNEDDSVLCRKVAEDPSQFQNGGNSRTVIIGSRCPGFGRDDRTVGISCFHPGPGIVVGSDNKPGSIRGCTGFPHFNVVCGLSGS